MKIKFLGAAGTVTGSCHLLTTDTRQQILLDCGLFQGQGPATVNLNEKIGVDPKSVVAVVLSHGHIDHSGRLPLLYKQGFRGKIYCTEATAEVIKVLLTDSAHIQEGDVRYINRQREKKGLPLLQPLYTIADAEGCLQQLAIVPFHQSVSILKGVELTLVPNGHLIGSATVFLKVDSDVGPVHLAYTGDVGRYSDPLLQAPENFPQADVLLCESTYGNREHETEENTSARLFEIIQTTCIEQKGRVIIPAFSLGRTQDILFILNNLRNKGHFKHLKVFVDSPLSSKATAVVKKYARFMRQEVLDVLTSDPDPFDFPELTFITEAEDSKMLNDLHEPCIIISASGMADAGRVKHHLMRGLPDARNTVVVSGYCAPETLGAKLSAGQKAVRIFGEEVHVAARVETLHSLSAHADYHELLTYIKCQAADLLKKIFLVHGDDDAREALRDKLIDAGYSGIEIPLVGETYTLQQGLSE
jgi:metallo-beta-lactamase family protein